MTHNQIEYWKLDETKRSNRVNERENQRHNVSTEKETSRHNYATEDTANRNLVESIRSNKARERETNRHNVATEGLSAAGLVESKRHNLVGESQNAYSISENARHNVASENEQQRHNVAGEQETNRHNLAGEAIDDRKVTVSEQRMPYQNFADTARVFSDTGKLANWLTTPLSVSHIKLPKIPAPKVPRLPGPVTSAVSNAASALGKTLSTFDPMLILDKVFPTTIRPSSDGAITNPNAQMH